MNYPVVLLFMCYCLITNASDGGLPDNHENTSVPSSWTSISSAEGSPKLCRDKKDLVSEISPVDEDKHSPARDSRLLYEKSEQVSTHSECSPLSGSITSITSEESSPRDVFDQLIHHELSGEGDWQIAYSDLDMFAKALPKSLSMTHDALGTMQVKLTVLCDRIKQEGDMRQQLQKEFDMLSIKLDLWTAAVREPVSGQSAATQKKSEPSLDRALKSCVYCECNERQLDLALMMIGAQDRRIEFLEERLSNLLALVSVMARAQAKKTAQNSDHDRETLEQCRRNIEKMQSGYDREIRDIKAKRDGSACS